jgi:HTH-type transcriptional regulator / antitoxin HipB
VFFCPLAEEEYANCPIKQKYVTNTILTYYGKKHIFCLNMPELARDPKQIGNLIRNARKHKALSQKELASMVGLRQENISMIENGYASTKLHNLLAVLAALELELQVSVRSTGDWTKES